MANTASVDQGPHRSTRNEIADKLAKEAAKSTTTQYEYKRIPKSYLQLVAAEKAKQNW